MGWRNRILLMSGICLLAELVSAPASAQARVGEAAVIKNQVHRVTGSATSQISVGDSVVRDEVVRTGLDSAARLVMADSTNLSLGPNASITLDRTVFNDEHSYREIAIRLATGAFRFVTGHSAKVRLQDHHIAGDDRRARHHPRCLVATRQDDGGAAGGRINRLHRGRTVRRADGAWPDRHHYLVGRQGYDSKDQHPALDLCRELRRGRGTLHGYEFC